MWTDKGSQARFFLLLPFAIVDNPMIDLFLSLSFWITAIAVTLWLTLTVLKFCIKNNAQEHRAQLLQELGPSALHIQQPQFLGFFHPYWYVSQSVKIHNTFVIMSHLVMPVEEVNAFFGLLYVMFNENFQTLFVRYIQVILKLLKNKLSKKSRYLVSCRWHQLPY